MISDVSRFDAFCNFEQGSCSLTQVGTLVMISTRDQFLVLLRA
jgi:hypothetical protein